MLLTISVAFRLLENRGGDVVCPALHRLQASPSLRQRGAKRPTTRFLTQARSYSTQLWPLAVAGHGVHKKGLVQTCRDGRAGL